MRAFGMLTLFAWACSPDPLTEGTLSLVYPPRASSRVPLRVAMSSDLPLSGARAMTLGECAATVAPDASSLEVTAAAPGTCSIEVHADSARGILRADATVVFLDAAQLVESSMSLPGFWSGVPFVDVGPNIAINRATGMIVGADLSLELGGEIVGSLDEQHVLVSRGGSCDAVDSRGTLVASLGQSCPVPVYVQRHRERPRLLGRVGDELRAWWWTGTAFEPASLAPGLLGGIPLGDVLFDGATLRVLSLADGSTVETAGAGQPYVTRIGEAFLIPYEAALVWLPEQLVSWRGGSLPVNTKTGSSLGYEGVGRLVTTTPFGASNDGYLLEVVDCSRGAPVTAAVGVFEGAPPDGVTYAGYRHVLMGGSWFDVR